MNSSISVWQQGPSARRLRTGLCIVGGGIAGLSAAIELNEGRHDFLILEARTPGAGASGRNAGYLMRGAADNYAQATREWGAERARALWRFTEENLAALRTLGAEHIPGFASRPSCLAALSAEEQADLHASFDLLRADGFDAELIDPRSPSSRSAVPDDALFRSARVRLGLLNPHDAVCDPAQLVALLRSHVPADRLITAHAVSRIEPAGSSVRLTCPGLIVEADRVLICTNAWAGQLIPGLAARVTPNRGQMLALRPHDPRDAHLAYAYYLNHGSEYARSGPDSTILFGGCRTYHADRERLPSEDISPWVQDHLERLARELLTPRFDVVARWAGVMGFSHTGLPLIEPVALPGIDAASAQVWFCGAFTGHGMSMGHLTGRAAARAALGIEAPLHF